jgi:hypothetical protein
MKVKILVGKDKGKILKVDKYHKGGLIEIIINNELSEYIPEEYVIQD